jgi:glycosyltransferase involved in cell wall biosynthesis
LKFCLLTTFYPPFNFGGDGIDVQRTAKALARRGHQVTVVHDVDAYEWVAGRSMPPSPTARDGVEVISLRSRFPMLSPLLTHQLGRPVVHGGTIRRILHERGCDVVVFNNVSLVGGPGLLAQGEGALRVYVAHEHWLVCPTHVLWRFNREPCDKRSCTLCVLRHGRPPQLWRYSNTLERHLQGIDLFIARSNFSRQMHLAFGFTHPMHVLPYFIPGSFPGQLETRTNTRPNARPYFLFVGRLTRIKGVASAISAFARYPDADFLIVGDGEELPALQSAAAHLPNVRFVGRVANEALRPYYEHAIATLAPSLGYETFGITLIESFRHGTPVVARRIGPFPEIVEQSGGGMLFSTDDELLQALSTLHRDSDLRDRLGSRGFAACRQRWSEDTVIGGFLDVIGQALERHGGRRDEPMPAQAGS